MRILIVNDDGMNAAALPHLIRWARKLGEVTCVVPKHEQSGKSQAIDFTKPVEIKKTAIAPDVTVWAMDSTPADCVRFGVTGLGVTYDLILSGINRGYNLGDDIAYSGTVGAIMEGGRLGIPSVALSTDVDTLDEALGMLDFWWEFMERTKLLEKGSLYNVNFPREATPTGVRVTHQGGEFYSDAFEYRGNDMYMQTGAPVHYDRCDLSIDIDAVRAGYISVTPMTFNKTDWVVLKMLNELIR
ncbi:MAG: 5'/3'-nucleotidase SurE [Clostridia bacterium]|nr:5'/3'-nucleotidase SurE [Clostridia bacterium]